MFHLPMLYNMGHPHPLILYKCVVITRRDSLVEILMFQECKLSFSKGKEDEKVTHGLASEPGDGAASRPFGSSMVQISSRQRTAQMLHGGDEIWTVLVLRKKYRECCVGIYGHFIKFGEESILQKWP